MPNKHGVYVSEQDTSLTTPIEGTAGLQVIFGTSPVNMTADPYHSANVPKICYSFVEAVQNMGYSDDFRKYTLCQSIDYSFRVFNVAPIICINVLDPNKPAHVTQVAADFYTLTNDKVTLGNRVYSYAATADTTYKPGKFYYTRSGEDYVAVAEPSGTIDGTVYQRVVVSEHGAFGVLLDTIVVKDVTGSVTYEKGVDYIASFDSDGYAVVTRVSAADSIPDGSTLQIGFTKLNPDGVTAADIIGGVSAATGECTGLECLNMIYPMFGLTPGLLIAPEWSDDPNVIAAMEAKCTGINGCFKCECLVDISSNASRAAASPATAALKYSDVKTAKENCGVDSPHAIACWPWGLVGEKRYAPSAVVAAQTAYLTAENADVPYIYPSNKSNGLTGACLEDGTLVRLDQEQGNLLNSYGVVTFINRNGYKTWGNNTAAYPSTTDPKDRYIAIRRMFTWWSNTLILTYFQRVDDPMNHRLIENIVDSENIRGNGFVARGMVADAHVEFRENENPVTSLLNGTIQFHLFLTPFPPAEDIEFLLEFDPNALTAAVNGGENG